MMERGEKRKASKRIKITITKLCPPSNILALPHNIIIILPKNKRKFQNVVIRVEVKANFRFKTMFGCLRAAVVRTLRGDELVMLASNYNYKLSVYSNA